VTGVQVTLEAQDQTHTTYTWEVLSQPRESMLDAGLVNNPEGPPGPGNPAEIFELNPLTPWIGSFTPNYTSGYLIRLTVDIGMITEDVSVLYAGIRLATSNLALPALTETVFDNSQDDPNYRGWEDKVDAFMKWVDAFIGGGVVTPPGWGRIYVDSVDGSDITGDGSVEMPYQTLPFATGTLLVTANPLEFLKPYEFKLAPGAYTTGGNITIPPRRKVTISGRDVVIGDDIRWHINPGWWTAVGLLSTDYPPELFFNGEGTGWQSLAFEYGAVPEAWGPSMTLLEPINIRNITPGTVWSGGQRLYMDMVSSVGILNEDSGGGAGAATGELFFFVNRCWFGGLLPDPNMSIGSTMELAVPPGEMNVIRIYANQTYFGVGIFSSCIFESVDQCTFHVINRLFDGSLAPAVLHGYIGCSDQGPVFRDCEFRDGSVSILYPGYIFGWDGGTGSLGEPYGPTFDKVSYRSLLSAEGLGNTFEVNNLVANLEVVVREGEARVFVSNDAIVDLVAPPAGLPYVPGNEYPLEWTFGQMDGDFNTVPGSPELISIVRDGRYRMSVAANIENDQILVDIVVGLGVWLNGAAMIADSDMYVSCLGGGGPFLPATPNATTSKQLFDMDLTAGATIDVRIWLHGFFVPAPAPVVETPVGGVTCWIERFE
jgi:hypothetical protein